MSPELQQFLALTIVALAAAFLAWSVIGKLRRTKSGCGGGCSGCGAEKTKLGEPQGFVPLENLTSQAGPKH